LPLFIKEPLKEDMRVCFVFFREGGEGFGFWLLLWASWCGKLLEGKKIPEGKRIAKGKLLKGKE
jgi:hypothetical protein